MLNLKKINNRNKIKNSNSMITIINNIYNNNNNNSKNNNKNILKI